MEMTIRMPDRYNVMSEEEMTYTNGGAAADVIAVTSTIVSTVAGIYAIYSTIWGITGARNWVAANKGGDLMTTAEKAINEGLEVEMDRAIEIEEKLFGDCFETQDQKDGMTAFLEKRKVEAFHNR